MKSFKTIMAIILIAILPLTINAQGKKDTPPALNSGLLSGMKFRSIGPAMTSGRIADIAVNPQNPSEYYVAVASGHVWKTQNNGTTFSPIFDNYGAYSMGCITVDYSNPNTVWLGTGENNHQRVLGYGNGVYKSTDAGKTWKNMGLKNSRQIGMIAIHPQNSNIVFVAAEGSAWASGEDRGLYKTTDAGKTWKKVLNISTHTGINNVVIDPKDPNIMYATSEQRRRHVHTKIGGGPESAIYKSYDGGNNWKKLTNGLPAGHIGGIGIAISPVDNNYVYAIIEAQGKSGGFFKSTDKGESWTKQSSYSTSGQYYGEIYCDPIDKNKVFSTETFSKYTTDGGKTWKKISAKDRHVDDHALWINPNNTNHLIIGGDGGLYESYDMGKNWRHISNLPVTQFYHVYLDDAKPFYNVYGGTQDNNSIGGPSQNKSRDGVTTEEWFATLGGDGFNGAVEPNNPDIVYSEYQYGNLYRYDKKSKEELCIKPRPGKNELTYRWNWNTPFMISPHNPTRLYIAANKLFQSNDRGNSWTTISPDLTANIDRNTWKVMDKYWSSDAVVKDVSTSLYGTIVALDESPVKEGLIYVGCDDGMIQVTKDGGKSWQKINNLPKVPENTYVSDIFADRFDENTVYVSLNNVKRDDFTPYIYKSTNMGQSWKSISNNLPENGCVRTIQQDFVNKNLIFVGTEFGVYFSVNGGEKWVRLKSGLPDIQITDIAIQKDASDLVVATFGRGMYILDDYSPLRLLNDDFVKDQKSYLFPVKNALQFIQNGKKYGQGATVWYAKNPAYGATFTYFQKEAAKTAKQVRQEKEKELFEKSEKIKNLTLRELEIENNELPPYLIFVVKNAKGEVVRKLTTKVAKGISRITWDLKMENPYLPKLSNGKYNPLASKSGGVPVLPGKYSVQMGLCQNGKCELSEPVAFNVKRLEDNALKPKDVAGQYTYFASLNKVVKMAYAEEANLQFLIKVNASMRQALLKSPLVDLNVANELKDIADQLDTVKFKMYGVAVKTSSEEIPPCKLPVFRRMSHLYWGHLGSTADITATEKEQLTILKDEVAEIKRALRLIFKSIKNIARQTGLSDNILLED